MHRFTVIIPKDLYHKLLELQHQKKVSGEVNTTMSQFVREALEAYLKNSPGQESGA